MLKPRPDIRDGIAIAFSFSFIPKRVNSWETFHLHACLVYGDLYLHKCIVDVPIILLHDFCEDITKNNTSATLVIISKKEFFTLGKPWKPRRVLCAIKKHLLVFSVEEYLLRDLFALVLLVFFPFAVSAGRGKHAS